MINVGFSPADTDFGIMVKDLGTFPKALQSKINELEEDPYPNQELILQEKTILETTQKEIQRLERKVLYSELGE